ncbi:hypothetical protein EVA_11376 [gut metagenome]|uniref:Uncharacterized protein n=1 Tax=gut metagenome TaxID=749906 RepID=J9G112_9ZZZZ
MIARITNPRITTKNSTATTVNPIISIFICDTPYRFF